MTSKELFAKIVEFGIQYDSHESDLYIPKTEQTTKLIAEYDFKENVTTFVSNIPDEHKVWYDIPFSYHKNWEDKCNE